MEQPQQPSTTQDERRSMALASLIISIVALLCSFMGGWRVFSIAIAGTAFIVGVFVLTKVRRPGPSKSMSVVSVVISIVAAALACYFLATARAEQEAQAEIPAELHDSAASTPDESTLDRLKNSMDTAQNNR
jgi:hypothetical protein